MMSLFGSLKRFLDGRGSKPPAVEQDPTRVHCAIVRVRVERVVNELQANGLGVQWCLQVVPDPPFFVLNVDEETARSLPQGSLVEVKIVL